MTFTLATLRYAFIETLSSPEPPVNRTSVLGVNGTSVLFVTATPMDRY
jgi:hypothetical protein